MTVCVGGVSQPKGRRDTPPSGFNGEYFRETADEARAIRREIDELLALPDVNPPVA